MPASGADSMDTPVRRREVPGAFALFAFGFRPFFLFTGIWALVGVGVWIHALHGGPLPEGPMPPQLWHGHEMIAGFIGAALAGFMLTASPNWTRRPGYAGTPLKIMVAFYVLARLALLPGSPLTPAAASVIGLLPVPVVLLMLLPALLKANRLRLYGPPMLLAVFWVGDVLMLGDVAGWFDNTFATGELLALDTALAMVGLVGGRVVPSFTVNALRRHGFLAVLNPLPGVDQAAVIALLAVLAVDLVLPDSALAGAIALIAAVLVLLRLSRWYGLRTLGQPIVWVLHLAYLLVSVALVVKAAWLLTGAAWAAAWLHMQAIGPIALMILAITTRAGLGHTGRDIIAPHAIVLAYLLVALAAPVRLLAPVFWPGFGGYTLAAALWLVAFGIYVAIYTPILVSPRPDGKPG